MASEGGLALVVSQRRGVVYETHEGVGIPLLAAEGHTHRGALCPDGPSSLPPSLVSAPSSPLADPLLFMVRPYLEATHRFLGQRRADRLLLSYEARPPASPSPPPLPFPR